jgi:hypothetical protein
MREAFEDFDRRALPPDERRRMLIECFKQTAK